MHKSPVTIDPFITIAVVRLNKNHDLDPGISLQQELHFLQQKLGKPSTVPGEDLKPLCMLFDLVRCQHRELRLHGDHPPAPIHRVAMHLRSPDSATKGAFVPPCRHAVPPQ